MTGFRWPGKGKPTTCNTQLAANARNAPFGHSALLSEHHRGADDGEQGQQALVGNRGVVKAQGIAVGQEINHAHHVSSRSHQEIGGFQTVDQAGGDVLIAIGGVVVHQIGMIGDLVAFITAFYLTILFF